MTYVTTKGRFGPWHTDRTTFSANTASTDVSAVLWVGDLPEDPTEVAALFTSLPDGAHISDDYDNPGHIIAHWSEPSTEADLAAIGAAVKEEADRAEFQAWRQAQAAS